MLKLGLKGIRYFGKGFFTPFERVFSDIPVKKSSEIHEFKTETRELLDIVAKSLYTDKEVFIRELVSNASDALEKKRFETNSGDSEFAEILRIDIKTNESERTVTIKDNGVGMTPEELKENLGTIAYSGSAHFSAQNLENTDSIIGEFGVGFYSCFIVADEVQVISRPENEEKAYMWTSRGLGEFEISELEEEHPVGTEIKLFLKEDCSEFSKDEMVNRIVRKYSNFLSYPIDINDNESNIKPPIWTKNKNEVTEEEYKDFYEYFSAQKVPYKYKFHFSLDMPLQVKALLFIPSTHKEKFGFAQEQAEIDLYSKKVLIRSKCRELLPNWMRFIKGVVDCEDIPLNISRETHQDSELMAKLNSILSKRILKNLVQESRKNERLYSNWFENFGNFIFEGMVDDLTNMREIAPLLRYHWSNDLNMISLDTYLENKSASQKKIYYLFTPNREYGMTSPYMEFFLPKEIPVIFSIHNIDETIFRTLEDYKGYKFVNIESGIEKLDEEDLQVEEYTQTFPETDLVSFTEWVRNELEPYVKKVVVSQRLRESPAVIIGETPAVLREMYEMIETEKHSGNFIKDEVLEINVNHEIMMNLNEMRRVNPELASDMICQVFDNALLNVGVFENMINMTKRMDKFLLKVSKID